MTPHRHACSLCGSRDWPNLETDCEQCYGEPEEGQCDTDDEREAMEPIDFPE